MFTVYVKKQNKRDKFIYQNKKSLWNNKYFHIKKKKKRIIHFTLGFKDSVTNQDTFFFSEV